MGPGGRATVNTTSQAGPATAGVEPALTLCLSTAILVPPPGNAPGPPDFQTSVQLLHQGGEYAIFFEANDLTLQPGSILDHPDLEDLPVAHPLERVVRGREDEIDLRRAGVRLDR